MARNTSAESWGELKSNPYKLDFFKAIALRAVLERPDSTARELSAWAQHNDPATLRRRLSELVREGLIRKEGSRLCTVTNRKGTIYRFVAQTDSADHPLYKQATGLTLDEVRLVQTQDAAAKNTKSENSA